MNTSNEDRTTSFFAQPGILAGTTICEENIAYLFYNKIFFSLLFTKAVIGGAVVGLLFAILVVMFIVYRMRKKDEGSYALDEPQKRSPQNNSYTKNHNNREFYA
jgi:syndecan 2